MVKKKLKPYVPRVYMRQKETKKLKDSELIVAHLLGGTSGLNLEKPRSPSEIMLMVGQAVRIMREIQKQCRE
jgi:hypothetical protein